MFPQAKTRSESYACCSFGLSRFDHVAAQRWGMEESLTAQWILTVFLLVVAIGFGIYGFSQYRNR
jgi:hypothetical protein